MRCDASATLLPHFASAHADQATAAGDGPATATLQNIFDRQPALSVRWNGKSVSALRVRLRLLNQASPLAYSLDIRRSAEYGDSWAAISLGDPNRPNDRSL
jgi:hypothetical protein